MPGMTNGYAATALDQNFVAGDYIGFSSNGTTEDPNLPRSACSWAAATPGAPASKVATGATVAATGGISPSHQAIFSAETEGVQKTDWQAVEEAPLKVLAAGDTYTPTHTVTQE